jgi:hypothetical protein
MATHFLNVDLDLYSNSDLLPLISAWGKKVIVLYEGRDKRTYHAHFEIATGRPGMATPDSMIRRFCALIRGLPPEGRKLWDTAKRRDFSVGIQVEALPLCQDFTIDAETIKAAAALNARIVFSIYSPELR